MTRPDSSAGSSRRLFSRRRVLQGTLGIAGVLAGSASGLVGLRGWAPAVAGLRCLSRFEYRTVALLATALFPEGGAFPLGASRFDLAKRFDDWLADEPDEVKAELKSALLLFEYGPVIFQRRLETFSHLDADARLAHFESWARSDTLVRRKVALGLRKFLSLVFYDQPEVWPSIGYGGPT
ncbi:MAG TPA: hypothetical protein VLM85_10735 [Polyangiaceae bacterium]|nr:hypothetical protein [Polyangiaceae bacterium]